LYQACGILSADTRGGTLDISAYKKPFLPGAPEVPGCQCSTTSAEQTLTRRVGQTMHISIYGVHGFPAGRLPNIRSYTVYIVYSLYIVLYI
jgi:hypothetical protein